MVQGRETRVFFQFPFLVNLLLEEKKKTKMEKLGGNIGFFVKKNIFASSKENLKNVNLDCSD